MPITASYIDKSYKIFNTFEEITESELVKYLFCYNNNFNTLKGLAQKNLINQY